LSSLKLEACALVLVSQDLDLSGKTGKRLRAYFLRSTLTEYPWSQIHCAWSFTPPV